MTKHCLEILFCVLLVPLLTSCTLTESELNRLSSGGNYQSSVKLSFRAGDILDWDTGVGKGTMKVLSVSNGKFTVEQRNEKNPQAEDIKMSGEIFSDGTCRIENPQWSEVWLGNLSGNTMVGKINNLYDFRITWKVPHYMTHSVERVSKLPFSRGDIVKWTSGTTRGTMKILSLTGDDFTVEKYNDFDKNKTPVKMRASLSKDGTCTLKSESGKEVWCGKLAGNAITGRVNNGYNFKITRSNSVWDMPFKSGNSLNWNANYHKGTIKVASVSSVGKFVFDLYSSYSTRTKDTSLDGEITADGTYKMVNRKTGEIWVGRRDGNKITGKINNDTKFTIEGLK